MITLWIVVGLILLLLYDYFIARKAKEISKRSIEEFFIAGRKVGWIISFLTFSATLFSAFTLVGMPGYFYTHGIGSWVFIAFADTFMALMIPLIGYRLWKIGKEFSYITPAQFLGERYESRILLIVVVLVQFIFLLPYMSIQAIGIGKLLESATGGTIPYLVGVGIALLMTVLYLESGGMRAVAWTDAVQGILLFVGGYFIAIYFLMTHFGTLPQLFKTIRQTDPSLLSVPGPKNLFTYSMMVSFFIMIITMPATQFQLTTRYFIAKNPMVLRRMMVFTAFFATFVLIPPLILGIGGKAIWPHLKSGDMVLGKVLGELIPPLAALGVIAVFSAALSTIDSQLLLLSSLFTRDIYGEFKKSDERKNLLIGRTVIVVLIIIIFLLSLRPPQLIVQLSILSFAGTLQLFPTIMGALYWKRATSVGAVLSILMGILSLSLFKWLFPKDWSLGFHPSIWGLFTGTVVFVIISLLTEPPKKGVKILEIFER
jgi:SSS family solute:Na+ symporter